MTCTCAHAHTMYTCMNTVDYKLQYASNLCNIVYNDSFTRLHTAAIHRLSNLKVYVHITYIDVQLWKNRRHHITNFDLLGVKMECPVLRHQMSVQRAK